VNGQLSIDGQVQPERVCICGCKRSLAGKRTDALWFSRACAVRWARENPGKSLYVARSANKGRTRGCSGPSGCQVSYRKAVDAAAAYAMRIVEDHARAQRVTLAEHVPGSVHRLAEIYMRRALPDRQRALLAAREQREEART
jgi:hypothetical protein